MARSGQGKAGKTWNAASKNEKLRQPRFQQSCNNKNRYDGAPMTSQLRGTTSGSEVDDWLEAEAEPRAGERSDKAA